MSELCVTVTLWPAMATAAERAGPLLAATVSVTLPAPAPKSGVTVIQLTGLPAVHWHDPLPDTVTIA